MKRVVLGWVLSLGIGSFAHAEPKCQLEIHGTDTMQFQIPGQASAQEMTVPLSCAEFTVTLKHVGKLPKGAMGHNWILVKTADFAEVSSAGLKAGPTKDYLPSGDKVIAGSKKTIGGGETEVITFKTAGLTKDGDYTFFCSFPGHNGLMKGKVKVI